MDGPSSICIPKKSGGIHICIDYRELNKRTECDSYPLPLIDEVQDSLAGSTIFSKLDLQSGYWQMPVNPKDKEKTAFCPGPGMGLYEFTRMPFGLTNAPSSFQRMIDKLFPSVPFVHGYIDDILISSKTVDEHVSHLQEVLQQLQQAGLTLRGHKCHIGLSQVTYLGHVFSAQGTSPDPEKIKTIKHYPVPTNADETRRFLGLASYYRRYIFKFSEIAAPLNQLTHKNTPFRWSSECGQSFKWLKEKLITSQILAYPQLDRNSSPFVLHTDASGQGIGAVLKQQGHVIGYASRSLSQSEQNYSVIQKECLAIVYATKQFRHYLLGRTFQLFTDHAPLQWLSAQKAEGMLCRWALMLQEFDFKISYKPGVKNTNADTLSRIPYQQCATTMFTSSDYRNLIQNAQQTDLDYFFTL